MHVTRGQTQRAVLEFMKILSRVRSVCVLTRPQITKLVFKAAESLDGIALDFIPEPDRWKDENQRPQDMAEALKRNQADNQALNQVRAIAHKELDKHLVKVKFKKVDALTKSEHPQKPQNKVINLAGNKNKITNEQIDMAYQAIFKIVLPRRESLNTDSMEG